MLPLGSLEEVSCQMVVTHSVFLAGLSTALTLVKVIPMWVSFLSNGLLMLGGRLY